MISFDEAEKLLTEYGQQHLLYYFDRLDDTEKDSLLSQIQQTDFSILNSLNRDDSAKNGPIEPPDTAVTSKQGEKYKKTGIKTIKDGKVACVLLAGGQGTRLGSDKPKGMYNIGVTRELYIFECLINNLLDVVKLTDTWIPLYVMTSEDNNRDTVGFLKEKNFFGYNSEYVKFFIQDMSPCLDFNMKILMQDRHSIVLSPNGNGSWFSAMVKSGLIKNLKENGIEWLNVFSVDNVLQRMADPVFIGSVIDMGYECGSKVVSKSDPFERVGVLCKENGKPSIIEYYEMTDDMKSQLDSSGKLAYRYGVTLNYLFRTEHLEKLANARMPVHLAEKKIPFMNRDGDFVIPDKPNGYKLETLVLDIVRMQGNCLPFEIDRETEFAPIKNMHGADSVDTARELLKKNGVEL